MTRDHIARLAETFVAEYRDPEIDARLYFAWWSDRRRLGGSHAERLWEAVSAALGETHPGFLRPRRRFRPLAGKSRRVHGAGVSHARTGRRAEEG